MRSRAEYSTGRAIQLRALAIEEAVYGPDHPEVATTLGNLGNVEEWLGELAEARATRQRALAIFEARLGKSHPYTMHAAQALSELAESD